MPKKQKVKFHRGDQRPGNHSEKDLHYRKRMAKKKLYDVENTAQNIVDRGKEPDLKVEDPYDKFSDFKI
jgi:hypothetical protein